MANWVTVVNQPVNGTSFTIGVKDLEFSAPCEGHYELATMREILLCGQAQGSHIHGRLLRFLTLEV